MEKLNHNNHIQLLRAIAVISVILFHTNPDIFSTGYLGVDIFFVISGYLICKVLNKYTVFNKSLLVNFYTRRARRTLPALFVMILATFPFFLSILMPGNLADYAQSLIVTPLFLSNFLFGSENSYWGAISELKPLLHTWSLSIEWQFYILFPLLFFFRNKFIIFLTLFLLSLISNFLINFEDYPIYINNHKLRIDNFFFTTNRIWEFLAGSCLYQFEKNYSSKIKKNNIISFIGLLLIFLSFYFFERSARQSIYLNLIPVCGVCLFIYFTNNFDKFNTIIKNKFLLHIGLISYSLYLWHQPILAYFKIIFNNNIPTPYYSLIYFLIYFFSATSFYLIEKTFYQKKILRDKKFILVSFLSIALIVLLGFIITSGKINITNSKIQKIIQIKKNYPKLLIHELAQTKVRKDTGWPSNSETVSFVNKSKPSTNTKNKKIKVFVDGDSHSLDLLLILLSIKKVNEFYDFSIDNLSDADAIIYTAQFYEESVNSLEKFELFQLAKKYNKKIIIFGRSAEFYTGDISPLIFNLIQSPKNLGAYKDNDKAYIDRNFYRILRDDIIKINKQLKGKAEKIGALYIDRIALACDLPVKSCHSITTDGYAIYGDHSHLTWKGISFFSYLAEKTNWLDPMHDYLINNN